MKTIWKAALTALSLAGAGALSGCAYDGDYYYGGGVSAGYGGYYGGGYCDSWGCPDNYWDMPLYYGSFYYGGRWYDGPHYYRDFGGRRQYWVQGGWRDDAWRGQRPSWYREGRTGPALGRDFYRSDRFRNEQRDFNRGGNNRPDANRGGNRGNFQPQQQQQQQAAPDRGPRGDGQGRSGGGFQRGDRGGDGGGDRGNRGRGR